MDKNTIWAIVLSTLVLVGFLFVEYVYVMPKQQERQQQLLAEQEESKAQEESLVSTAPASLLAPDEETSSSIKEEEYTLTTNKLKVVFTNRGGDIISYTLLEHLDKNTGVGVEMVDNVTSNNRAFSLGFGGNNAPCVNDIFKTKVEDVISPAGQKEGEVIYFYKDFLSANNRRFRLIKRYEFKNDDYVFQLGIEISSLDGKGGLDFDGSAYSLRTPPQIGPHYDKTDRYEVRQYLALNGNKKVNPSFTSRTYDKEWEWAGVAGKYFAVLVKPSDIATMSTQVRCANDEVNGYQNSQVYLTRKSIEEDKTISQDTYYVYVGPRREKELIKYNLADKNSWGLLNAKFNQALYNSTFLSLPFVETFIKWSLEMIYKLVKNWGVAIIVLTILIRIVLFPLSKSSAMGSLKMQQIQPKMMEIQEKYKNSKSPDSQQKLAEKTQKLYKEAGYNPASGCLPMIIQMFILFAMYSVFNNYFEFRGASFIPGWIDDLSIGESVWSWNVHIPLISSFTQNKLRVLPFIYLISQLLNGKITQYGGAGGMGGQQATQMKMMMYGMPIMFFFVLYNVPSGLIIYWTISNIFQMGQQIIINKAMQSKREEINSRPSSKSKNNTKISASSSVHKGSSKKKHKR